MRTHLAARESSFDPVATGLANVVIESALRKASRNMSIRLGPVIGGGSNSAWPNAQLDFNRDSGDLHGLRLEPTGASTFTVAQ